MKKHEIIQQALSKLGGPGSGHHGHKGIPGHRGGSAPSGGGGIAGSTIDYDKESYAQAAEATPLQFAAVRAYTQHPEVNEFLRGQRDKPREPETFVVDDEAYNKWREDHYGRFLPENPRSGWMHDEDPKMPLTINAEYADHYWKSQNQKISPIQIQMKESDIVEGIDSATKPLKEDMVLYRGSLGTESWKLKGGEVFTDKGFLSTTTKFDVTERFGVDFFEIRVPKGTDAVFADAFSKRFPEGNTWRVGKPYYMGTGEVLLSRNLDYKYLGSKDIKGKSVRIFEVHPTGSLGATRQIAPRISKKKYK